MATSDVIMKFGDVIRLDTHDLIQDPDFVLLCAVQLMYMLPLEATASVRAYRRVLYAVLVSNGLSLYARHGRIRFSTDVRDRCRHCVPIINGNRWSSCC